MTWRLRRPALRVSSTVPSTRAQRRCTLPNNAATQASDRTFLAFAAEDWPALEAQPGPQFIYRDHRNGVHTEFDASQWIESMRLMVASNARPQRRQLSVLGERVMLEWVRWTGRSDEPEAEGAEFEVDLLRVVEVEANGLLASVSVYDGDDRRAANDELWRLYEQSDDGRRLSGLIFENRRAFSDHDLEAMRATLRDDFVWDDHRRTGSGELGADAYLESVAALFASTSELVSETLYFDAISQWGTISVASMFGTAVDGGEFENVLVRLSMTDGQLLTRVEVFEVDDLDLAGPGLRSWARLERADSTIGRRQRSIDGTPRCWRRIVGRCTRFWRRSSRSKTVGE